MKINVIYAYLDQILPILKKDRKFILGQILLFSINFTFLDQILLNLTKNSSIGCKIYFRSDSTFFR